MTEKINSGDVAWILTASGLVLLMTPGLALFYGGMVRRKNLVSTMFQSLISMALISLAWVIVGFSLAFGKSIGGLIGNPFSYFVFNNVGLEPNAAFAATIPFALFALFQLKFAIITPALITGAFAERIRFKAYLLFALFFHIFIYCPVAHWMWHPDGFLHKLGVLDFAGGVVVHITAGIAALVAALTLHPRSDIEPDPMNIPFVLLGTGLLWFGWFGFNAGSALSANGQAVQAFLTTNTASAAGMVTWMILDWVKKGKPTALGACIGAVVALVAITPAAGYVSVGASLLIGVIAPVISYFAVRLRSKTSVDDTLDVFPCHGVGGIVGMLLTAVFAQGSGMLEGHFSLMFAHLIGLAVVVVYTVLVSYLGLIAIRAITPLQVSEEGEIMGLDVHQHGETDTRAFEPA